MPIPREHPSAARFLQAARRQSVDRPPVWLMRQAGRYLPEYQALRAQHDFVTCCTTPELAAEISLQPFRRFQMDGVVVFCDILMPLSALGLRFAVPDGGPRLEPRIATIADVATLRSPVPERDYAYLATTLRQLRRELHEQAALIGFCGGPFTVASYLLTGGRKPTREIIVQGLLQADHFRERLFATLVPMLADYLTLQAEAGAQVLQIFETWAGLLTVDEFRHILTPALQTIISTVQSRTRRAVPIILFCQQGDHVMTECVASGCDVVSLGTSCDLATMRRTYGDRVALQGNLDPELLCTDPETIRGATTRMLQAGGTMGYIANLGHGVVPQTAPEHVATFVRTVQQWDPATA